MDSATERTALYCVGCGVLVCRVEPGATLAIACRCGALAPVLQTVTGDFWTPVSFLAASGHRPPPHLEYYLGFSDHESETKQQLARQLRALGSVSYTECEDDRCRGAWERARWRYEERERRKRDRQRGLCDGF